MPSMWAGALVAARRASVGLRPASIEALRAWMEKRMELDELGETGVEGLKAPLTEPDLALLYEVVLRLCDALAHPQPPEGCQAGVGSLWKPVLVATGAEGLSRRYRWICDPWGRERGGGG